MNQTQDVMNCIHLGLDNGALALEEQTVGAATLKALTATEKRVQRLMVELLVPSRQRQDIAQAFAIVRGGMEQMVDLDERDHKLAQQLCGAHEALVARKERAAGKAAPVATEAVATRQG